MTTSHETPSAEEIQNLLAFIERNKPDAVSVALCRYIRTIESEHRAMQEAMEQANQYASKCVMQGMKDEPQWVLIRNMLANALSSLTIHD